MTELAPESQKAYIRNNMYIDVICIGFYHLNIGRTIILLNDVLYIPKIRRNILSIPTLTRKELKLQFVLGKVTIGKYGRVIFEGNFIKEYGMFKFNEINKPFGSAYIDYTLNVNMNM